MNATVKKTLMISIAHLLYFSGLDALRRAVSQIKHGPRFRVLAYHRVNDVVLDKEPFTVRTRKFEEQIACVAANFKVMTFSEILEARRWPQGCVEAVVITFDDGYYDNFTNAVPILLKYGLKACFFLTTGLLGQTPGRPSHDGKVWKYAGMTWDHVRELHAMGFEIGAHTVTHPNLMSLSLDDAKLEIVRSKQEIEARLQQSIRYFAYPMGKRGRHYNCDLQAVAREEFEVLCTTTRGPNFFRQPQLFEVKRIAVQGWWWRFYFLRELNGVFDFAGDFS